MKYYNTATQEIKLYDTLKFTNGFIFPLGEAFGTWVPVRETYPPVAEPGFHIEYGDIAYDEAGGFYYHSYRQMPNTPEPPPAFIEPFQGKAILIQDGLYDAVKTYINNPELPEIYRVAWESARTWERESVFVNTLLQLLGLTPEQGDDMFRRASLISLESLAN